MADIEMIEADRTPEQSTLGFGVLQFIKTAQSQHGLRHNDYKRYRYVLDLSCTQVLMIHVHLDCKVVENPCPMTYL